MADEKKILVTLASLSGFLISLLLAINGFFLAKTYDRIDMTYDRAVTAGQAIAVLTARLDTYMVYKRGKEEGVSYGQKLRKRNRYRLIHGI